MFLIVLDLKSRILFASAFGTRKLLPPFLDGRRAQNQLVCEGKHLAYRYREKTAWRGPKTECFFIILDLKSQIFSARAFGARECLLPLMNERRTQNQRTREGMCLAYLDKKW